MFDFSIYVSGLCLTSPIMWRVCIWLLDLCVEFVFGLIFVIQYFVFVSSFFEITLYLTEYTGGCVLCSSN